MKHSDNLRRKYQLIRARSIAITAPLKIEDYVVQPIVDVSPPKWHLAHTTWFFETFVLKSDKNYKEFNPQFNFLFNSYYESIGERTLRTDRGNITRPTVDEVLSYRNYVDEKMDEYMTTETTAELQDIIALGLQHEQQHQELLLTDIKYILGHNPTFPVYSNNKDLINEHKEVDKAGILEIEGGLYDIGHEGNEFCFDNELGRHKIYLHEFALSSALVSNAEYQEFIEDGAYKNPLLWHSDGWTLVQENKITSPMYWHKIDNKWMHFTFNGLNEIDPNTPVTHINFYEAHAFAEWKNKRLPTEFEWEVAANQFNYGERWEWTNSAYLPYPGYKKAPGAIGEYNGKFMINQMVLRGGSCASSPDHIRKTYRNFFHPHLQWQYTGIRLAELQ